MKKTTAMAPNATDKQSFDELEDQITEAFDNGVSGPRTDPQKAALRVFATAERIKEFQSDLKALPGFDKKALQELVMSANALLYTLRLVAESKGLADELRVDLQEAAQLRKGLGAAAAALAGAGLLSEDEVTNLRSGNSYADIAVKLKGLAELFLENWKWVKGKTWITQDQLSQALELSDRIRVKIVDAEEAGPKAEGLRNAAFAVMARKLDAVRRGLTYLRWDEGDARELMPSLWKQEAPRKRAEKAEDAAPEVAFSEVPVEPEVSVDSAEMHVVPATPEPPAPVAIDDEEDCNDDCDADAA